MAPYSKKRKACRAAFEIGRNILRQRKGLCIPVLLEPEEGREELGEEVEEGSEEELEGGADGELVMAEDAFTHLMAMAIADHEGTGRECNIKYHRGPQRSRQTLWRDQKKKETLRQAAANTTPITQFFSTHPIQVPSPVLPLPSKSDLIRTAITDLKILLQSKKAPIGQNLMRHTAVLQFMQLQLKRPDATRKELSLCIAEAFSRGENTARRIHIWEKSWITSRYIKVGMRGKYAKVSSWLNDEGVLLAIREYITSVGEKLTSHGLAQAITAYLKEEGIVNGADKLENSISERTARTWLNKLGFQWKDVRKGVYIDGHEREDVVAYRQKVFLPALQKLEGLRQWDEKGNIIPSAIPAGEKEKIFVTHDESTFNANDGKRQMWIKDNAQPLRKKGRGKGIMVSEFLTPRGRLAVPPNISAEGLPRRQATEFLEYGQDNYWTGEKMVQHVVDVAIPIFERAFPGCQAVFLFDTASNHAAFAPDALVVNGMNLGPGGKQPILREGFIHAKQRPQAMVFPDNYPDPALRGKPKGIKQILIERELWRTGMRLDCKPKCQEGMKDCCARQCLRNERDFQEQKGYLQEAIEARGHRVIFYPKFHCELNFIEFFWAAAKRHARENCEYSLQGLRDTIPQSLASVSETTIWRFYQKCQRTMQAYRDGCHYGTAEFKDRVYKSHRRTRKCNK